MKNNVIPRKARKIKMQALTGCSGWNVGDIIEIFKDDNGWHYYNEKMDKSWYMSPSFIRNPYYFRFISVIVGTNGVLEEDTTHETEVEYYRRIAVNAVSQLYDEYYSSYYSDYSDSDANKKAIEDIAYGCVMSIEETKAFIDTISDTLYSCKAFDIYNKRR